MSRTARTTRKTIDVIASHNEDAALAVMRAAERMSDELLRQQLFKVIHRLNQDAAELRLLRETLPFEEPRRA
ncbi:MULTISPECIES: hypothetical protein [unclassified Pseudomonas]|uniref:hypothetical protein n=1 Tax=unclassified Pseudomonas TaxID=196821 RepID=UPI0024478837|nr:MULTISPECIES: hypothetical protein [unclassified Pseudomonas]MDG9923912.1 hypothetical protein [Pseudomonas sp. GD04045]MDH0035101.1 hypothetical protein [Pseudomonas sp. GD04019]